MAIAEDIAASVFGDQPDAQPAEIIQPPPAPPEPPRPPDVPLATYLDLQAEAREMRKRIAEQEAKANQKPEPDFYDDPPAVLDGLRAQMAEQAWLVKRDVSAEAAIDKHGEETVKAAMQWAEQNRSDPASIQTFKSQPNPFNWLVKQFKADQTLRDIGDDPDAYVRRRYAELEGGSVPQAAAPAAVRPATAPSAPPRSLAGAPSAAPSSAQAPVSALDGALSRLK